MRDLAERYDAVVIGAGAGGGVAAGVLAEAGHTVLLLERGRDLGYLDAGRDHLRNQRLALYGHNAGPEIHGNPRVAVDQRGEARVVRPHEAAYQNNAAAVGGGTRVYGAQAWRFLPADFTMASRYGAPPGSSLADWPITYDDLEPCYDRAEWELGVAGEAAHPDHGPRRRGYPMPPVPDNPQRLALARGAAVLSWPVAAPPLLINTVAYGGRAPCVRCGNCIGFACPSEGKNGTHNTLIPRALATGRCTLRTRAMAQRIVTDARGHVTGVAFVVDREDGTIVRHAVSAGAVVVAGGAIETARLLLNSACDCHPRGLGNATDQVGRHLQGHYYAGAFGLMPEPLYDARGPGVSIATCRFNHGNPGVIGGGMLANEFIKTPIMFWRTSLPPDLPRWGAASKRFMREGYRRVIRVQGPVQEIPNPDSRITIDPAVRDRYGLPVARLSGTGHPETVRAAEFLRGRAEEWLRASGATRVWSRPARLHLSAGQHQAGTCRMGDDPRTSVTDRWGRVHGHDNLYVADGSLHVTNGGVNPVLTILALAYRVAGHLAQRL